MTSAAWSRSESAASMRSIDELCNNFEAACQSGNIPRPEDYLDRAPESIRMQLLKELLQLEVYYSKSAPPDFISYAQRFPNIDRITLAEVIPAAQDAIEPKIPGYEILGLLGRGGMGIVYKARDLKLGRLVALKMVLPGSHVSDQVIARMIAEARAVARLQHPQLVQIYDIVEFEGRPLLVFEYIEGGTLADKISKKAITIQEAAQWLEIIARSVQFAHSRGIVHRDLKPANILMTLDGSPKISDFGLARQMDNDIRQTHSGMLIGTPGYMAPEQAELKQGDFASPVDIYALGSILYEVLTGQPPFRGASILETLEMVRSQEPTSLRKLNRKVPRDLETICLKCLQKDPMARYASASLLAEDLGRFLRNDSILARPSGLVERSRRWCKRSPWVASFAALTLLVTLIGFASVFWQWKQTELERQRADEHSRMANQNAALYQRERDEAIIARGQAIENASEAERNRQQAERNLSSAELRYKTANQAAENLLRVGNQLIREPKMDSLGKKTIESAMKIKQLLLEEKSDDPKVRLEIAETLIRFAWTQAELGLYVEARDTNEQALAWCHELINNSPGNISVLRGLRSGYFQLGIALNHLRKYSDEYEALKKSVAFGEEIIRLPAHSDSDLVLLANAKLNSTTRMEFEEKKQTVDQAIPLLRTAVEKQPHDTHFKLELALGLGVQAFLFRGEAPAQAELLYREAVDLLRENLDAIDTPRVDAYYFSRANRNFYNWLISLNRFDEAEPRLLEAIKVAEQSSKAFPNYAAGRMEYGMCLWTLSGLQKLRKETDASNATLQQTEEMFKELCKTFPEDASIRRTCTSVISAVSERLESLHEYAAAIEKRKACCEIFEELWINDLNNAERFKSNGIQCFAILRDSMKLTQSEDRDAAIAYVLNKTGLRSADYNNLSWDIASPANASKIEGDIATALAERAMELDPKSTLPLNTYGVALMRAEKFVEARQAFERSLAAETPFPEADWYMLAILDQREGLSQSAREKFDKGRALRLQLHPTRPDLLDLEKQAVQELSESNSRS